MSNEFKFDWTNPDEFTNDLVTEKLEKYMVDILLLNPETETPTFDRENNSILCNNFKFTLPIELKELL